MSKAKKNANKERAEKEILEGIEAELSLLGGFISEINDTIKKLTQEVAENSSLRKTRHIG